MRGLEWVNKGDFQVNYDERKRGYDYIVIKTSCLHNSEN